MHAVLHATFSSYFTILEQFGLLSVVVLMAMQSTVFPVPSEIVVPPATYLMLRDWQGHPLPALLLVAATATFGCLIGAGVTYWVARVAGRPMILRFGKFCFFPEKKVLAAERWVAKYGAVGIFTACLLPVVRSFHSIPAGLMCMPFGRFMLMIFIGSALWCTILTFFGWLMAGNLQLIMETGAEGAASKEYRNAFRNLTILTLSFVGLLVGAYIALVRRQMGTEPAA